MLFHLFTDPYKGFYLRHHNGMCFTVDVHNDRIYLSWRCQDKFEWLTMSGYKYFRHIASQLCIGRVNNGPRSANWLILKHCKRSTATPYKFTDSPKNLKTTMGAPQCIHPNGGLWNPKDGTYLLTHPVCGEKRIAMNLSNGTNLQCFSAILVNTSLQIFLFRYSRLYQGRNTHSSFYRKEADH